LQPEFDFRDGMQGEMRQKGSRRRYTEKGRERRESQLGGASIALERAQLYLAMFNLGSCVSFLIQPQR